MKHYLYVILLVSSVFVGTQRLNAQFITISGTVYDISARKPLEAVAVISTSGRGTVSDSLGRYSLTVRRNDSIYFSLFSKNTMKYVADTISNPSSFDVSLHVHAALLPEVKVRSHNYRLDSIENRREYAKYFDFKKPGIRLNTNPTYTPGGVTVGLDLEEFINMFRFKRNRNLQYLQNRLIQQEQDKYINHRFTKLLVRKITPLQGAEIDTFMIKYRPPYELLQTMNDLEFGQYVQYQYGNYVAWKNRFLLRRKND